jgi:thioredoxin-dependent peroxiredoxin
MASVDPPDVNKKFAEQEHADFPILSDPEKTTATAYGVVTAERQMAARWTFYIGADGKILDIDKGTTGRGVSVRTAGEDTIKKLDALGVKKKNK